MIREVKKPPVNFPALQFLHIKGLRSFLSPALLLPQSPKTALVNFGQLAPPSDLKQTLLSDYNQNITQLYLDLPKGTRTTVQGVAHPN